MIAPPLRGHYRPLSFLADELIRRGHRVTFIHQEEARELVDSAGAGFAPVGARAEPVADWTTPMRKIRGIIGLGGVMARMERFTSMFCHEAPWLLRDLQVDAVIADQLEPGGGLVAEHLGLPWISTATTLPMNREASLPPPFVGWGYDPSPAGLKRSRGGWRVSDFLLRGFNRTIARNAEELGLRPRRRMEDCFSPFLQLSQSVPGIEFPRRELPGHFHYTGPFRARAGEPFVLPPDPRPTIYCTLGTLQGSRTGMFRKIAMACQRADARLVITVGHNAKGLRPDDLPGKPLVYDWLPQESAIAQSDAVVSHAGMNSALDPLVAGKPMVVLPLAFEQPGIAARVAYSGAGIALSRTASVRTLGSAIEAVLHDASYKRRAEALQTEILAAGGVVRATDLIEGLLGSAAPREAATRAHAAQDDARGGSRNGSS